MKTAILSLWFAMVAHIAIPVRAGPAERGLRTRLETGEPVTFVVFGDSISAGAQIARPEQDAFFAVFERALRAAFPAAQASVQIQAVWGECSRGGLARLDPAVIPRRPDLVTVQFGGNDERLGRPLPEFRANLTEIVRRLRRQTGAELILIVQPFQQQTGDSRTVLAIRQVAGEQGVPLADFDTALRRRPHDVRGWYAPFFNHPREYSANLMARELWRVFEQTLGRPHAFDLDLADAVLVSEPGEPAVLAAELRSRSQAAQRIDLRIVQGDTADADPLTVTEHSLEPGSRQRIRFNVAVPDLLPGGRSVQRRVFCVGRTGVAAAFDTKWLTCAPLLLPQRLSATAAPAFPDWTAAPSATVATNQNIVLGADQWSGAADLSVRFWCAVDTTRFWLAVAVRDDTVLTHDATADFPLFFGDCVQLNLDCRPQERQGLPLYDEHVPQLFLVPGRAVPEFVDWSFGDRPERTVPPSGRWSRATIESTRLPDGYRIVLSLPLAALRPDEGRTGCIGFDLVVDDRDTGNRRDTQMVWAGSAENYLNPAWYGALDLAPAPAANPGLSNRVRLTFH